MPNTNKTTRPIDATFRANVIADSNSGWPCVQMPDSAEFFGTGKCVKVGGTVDGHDYEATMLPVGGGTHAATPCGIPEGPGEGPWRRCDCASDAPIRVSVPGPRSP